MANRISEVIQTELGPGRKCTVCGESKPYSLFYKNAKTKSGYRSECKVCVNAALRIYKASHPEVVLRNQKNDLLRNGKRRMRVRNESARKIRLEVIEAYGATCVCCDEKRIQFLTLDHIQGGGGAHRQRLGARGVYNEVKRLGFPRDTFRLLCMNCNFARRFGKQCPHEMERSLCSLAPST